MRSSPAVRSFVVAIFSATANTAVAVPPAPLVNLGARLNNCTDSNCRLRGFADLHAHPMSHLGFGGKLVHGAPDEKSLMPAGTIWLGRDCTGNRPANDVATALGACYATHAGQDAARNVCGNHFRQTVIANAEPHSQGYPQPSFGYPFFADWPKFNAPAHQQMWVDWIERAYRGGLRLMVALAVNSVTMAKVVDGVTEIGSAKNFDDKSSGELQIAELKAFVARHSWMEIARSPADLREIVGKRDHLAIVIGVELDDIGSFMFPSKPKDQVTANVICHEIERLDAQGVRYIFPVHLINNLLGTTAVNTNIANLANRAHFGRWWNLGCADPKDGIDWKHRDPKNFFAEGLITGTGIEAGGIAALAFGKLGILPTDTAPIPHCEGHVNQGAVGKSGGYFTTGLKAKGRAAVTEMMRLGMLIDVDHSSQRTVDDILEVAKRYGYPVVSGHNGLRKWYPLSPSLKGNDDQAVKRNGVWYLRRTEYHRRPDQYQAIARLGGVAGVGWTEGTAEVFLQRLIDVLGAMNQKGVALGTDINGLVTNPSQPGIKEQAADLYNASFPIGKGPAPDPKYQGQGQYDPHVPWPTKPREWNFLTDGVAHYGLIPDLLRYLVLTEPERSDEPLNSLFDGVEAFAAMWKQAEARKATIGGKCGLLDLKKPCHGDLECLSGRCDRCSPGLCAQTAKCIPQDWTGRENDYCTHDNHCISGSCKNRVCEGKRELGESCNGDRQCSSGRCDRCEVGCAKTAKCIPRDGTGPDGRYCTHNNQCRSKACRLHPGQPHGNCS